MSVTDEGQPRCKKGEDPKSITRHIWRKETDHWERQMSYLWNVANQRPMLRVAGEVVLAFCCAAPLVLLFSSLAATGLRSLLH